MARTRLLFSLSVIILLSGCSTFFGSQRLSGKAEAMISEVLAPNLLYVGDGQMYRKLHLLGVSPMDPGHENYEHIMNALGTLKGTEIRIRFPGENFWRTGPVHGLVYYDRLHEILPETGSSVKDENVLLNVYILRHGFGRFHEGKQRIPDGIRKVLIQAEADAKSTGLGVWERAKLAE